MDANTCLLQKKVIYRPHHRTRMSSCYGSGTLTISGFLSPRTVALGAVIVKAAVAIRCDVYKEPVGKHAHVGCYIPSAFTGEAKLRALQILKTKSTKMLEKLEDNLKKTENQLYNSWTNKKDVYVMYVQPNMEQLTDELRYNVLLVKKKEIMNRTNYQKAKLVSRCIPSKQGI